jgi:hypothetical protein
MKPARADEDTCADCGAQPVRMNLGTVPLCDRCFDARIAASTGWPRLPEAPEPETIAGPDGRLHRIVYRLWRSPGGVAVEAEEDGEPFDGFYVEVVGPHDADPAPLVERTRAAIRRRIGHQDLTLRPGGAYWIMAGPDLRGRLVWNEDGGPYDVVVDGRRLGWEEFGRALEPFEGWEFRLSFRHEDVDVDEREPGHDPAGAPIPSSDTPGTRFH